MARIEGFREASRQLAGMKKAMAAGVGRRALQIPATILADAMRERAPELEGNLKRSIGVEKERAKKGRPQVAAKAGDIASVQVEFGNGHQAAEPFARPAEEATRTERLDKFGAALKDEVDKTVIRAAKRRKV
ncbi:HK97-gp10 family putative phage morphogenesis protein [Sphingomonas hankookensis]|uniref:Phage protein, HK97 gp10 family n=1 Tax=Sphingomonas hankookensis TaxID=563996 RepID=A0ABR5YDQ9_9SPHN|nr:HK97-gp10 family putative phage morphogenesis protein [Sphingomonas hankookensis]KZE16222.1 hypothetical protein AVT10_12030 [Sphingomonas hankookensis]